MSDTDSGMWVEVMAGACGSSLLRALISSATEEARPWAERNDGEEGGLRTGEKE